MHKYWMYKMNSWGLRDKADDGMSGGGSGGGSGGTGSGAGEGSGEGSGEGVGSGEGEGQGQGSGECEGEGSGGSGESKQKPTDAEAKLLKEVMDKKTALRKTQAELEEVKNKLKDFEGLDAAELRALLEEKKALETRKLEEKGEWDRLKAQMVEENKKAVDAVNAQLAAEKARADGLARQVAELTVGGAFTSSAFIKEELTLPASKARALYGAHFEYDAEKGAVVAYDKAAGSAERTIMVDAQGEPLSFEAALKKLVDADPDRDQITKSKVKVGTGSRTTEKGKAPAQSFDQPKGVNRIAAALRAAAGQK